MTVIAATESVVSRASAAGVASTPLGGDSSEGVDESSAVAVPYNNSVEGRPSVKQQ